MFRQQLVSRSALVPSLYFVTTYLELSAFAVASSTEYVYNLILY